MKRLCLIIICILIILNTVCLANGSLITDSRLKSEKYNNDSLAIKSLRPDFDTFFDSSIIDFSYLLDPPSGKYGFVKQGEDGHLYFDNGNRARFWGVVVDQEMVDIPFDRIDEIMDALARAGANMLRLHSMDNRGDEKYMVVRRSVIDDAYPNDNDSRHFDPDYLKRIDYWIFSAKKRGIYVYLVNRAYRTFKSGDGVQNADQLDRAARPEAFFDEKLIELQKEYAENIFVKHINPFTNLSYANDPTVAIVEVFNEDSLFMRPEKWDGMPDPYKSNFKKLWNEWLKKEYGTTENLRKSWTSADGICALAENESPGKMNVALPNMNEESYEKALNSDYKDIEKSLVRRRDGVRFAIDVQRKYFATMRDFMRSVGIKVPFNGVVHSQSIPDTYSLSREFEMTAGNAYYDHPTFLPQKDWISESYFKNENYIGTYGAWSFTPFITRYKWAGHSIAVREWSTCWPNEYRASSILEASAYALFQDIDLITYFDYVTTGDFMRLGTFGIQSDPLRWGLFGLASKMFHEKDLETAKKVINVVYSNDDIETFSNYMDFTHILSYMHKVQNCPLDELDKYKADAIVTSGRSNKSNIKEKNAIIFTRSEFADNFTRKPVDDSSSIFAQSGYKLNWAKTDNKQYEFSGFGFDENLVGDAYMRPFQKAFIIPEEKNLIPQGLNKEKGLAFALIDKERNNLLLADVNEEIFLRYAVDFMNRTYGTPMTHKEVEQKRFVSDTGQIIRDSGKGILFIDSEKFKVISGKFKVGEKYSVSGLDIISQSPIATIVVTSLDNKALTESEKFVVKMVTVAENRLQAILPSRNSQMKDYFVLATSGMFPVQTHPVPSETPTKIMLNNQELINVYLKNGTFEIVFDYKKGEYLVFCDGNNVKFKITPLVKDPLRDKRDLKMICYYYSAESSAPETITRQADIDFIYPAYSKYVEIY